MYFGWVIVASAFIVLTAAFGLQLSFGVFLPHMVKEFGLSYAAISAPFSIYLAVYALLSYITGRLTDLFGPRLLVLAGGAFLGAGYALLGLANEIWHFYVALCAIAALGMSAAPIPLNATVVKWFVRRRGLALAVTGTGTAAAAIFGPGIATYLIPWLGWRGAIITLAFAAGGIIAICALVLVRDPEARGLKPDGDATNDDNSVPSVSASPPEISWTLTEALSTMAYWALLCTFMFAWMTLFLPYIHLPAMLTDLGHAPASAAGVISALGIGGLAGRIAVGWLSDRIGRVLGIQLALSFQVVACVIFAQSQSVLILGIAAAMFSAGASSTTIMFLAIVGDVFGRLHVGANSGFIFAVAGAISAIGPYMAGVFRDITGTYQLTFLIAAGCNLTAMGVFAFFRTPQKRSSLVSVG